MAVIEQLLFGSRLDGHPGRDVLACSPGLEPECAREIVELCEGWGRVPADGLRRPTLLAMPLEARLHALPGRLHVVIRAGTGLKPLFHGVVLADGGFAEFGRNPFDVAAAGVFLDVFVPGQLVSRREVAAAPAAHLEALPGPDDLGFVDEALRQLLAHRRLDLPLEAGSEESDRFLNLVICALPSVVRRELRFASWTPGGRNTYDLAAVHCDAAFFRAWRPYLMASPLGPLNATAEAYIAQVREYLGQGDLPGLWQTSESSLVELGLAERLRGNRPGTLAATVLPPRGGRAPAPRPRPRAAESAPAMPRRSIPTAASHRRSASSGISGWGRGLATLLVLGIIAVAAQLFLRPGGWNALPGSAGAPGVTLHANPNYGILDVGRLHDEALRAVSQAQFTGQGQPAGDPGRTQDVLRQAAQLLDTQAEAYIDQVAATLATGGRGDIHAATEALPADKLAAKGGLLMDELRRLALADVSLSEGAHWRDLSRLGSRELTARHDSIATVRGGPPASEIWIQVDGRLREVAAARLRVTTLDRLQNLLAQRTWSEGWDSELDQAARKLDSKRSSGASRWRQAARALADLKRAEQEADFPAAAFALDDPTAVWRSGPVAAAVRAVRRAQQGFADLEPPILLSETVRFYDGLARGWAGADSLPPDRLAALIRELDSNRLVSFQPQVYGDHVARLGVAIVHGLRARGLGIEAVPDVAFPGGNRRETEVFLAAEAEGRDSAGWQRELASFREPFFARWAARLARQADATHTKRATAFEASYQDLAALTTTFAAAVAAGHDPGPVFLELRSRTTELLRDHPDRFVAEAPNARRWLRLEALQQALSVPLDLVLTGVTVRVGPQVQIEEPVLVELEVASGEQLTTAAFALGPAAPAGSGAVGTTAVAWNLKLAAGDVLHARVLRASDRREILHFDYDPWFAGGGPDALRRFQTAGSGRLAWTLGASYWAQIRLPEL